MAALLAAQPDLWRCSVDRYHEMVRQGILSPEDRVELLDGLIVNKGSNDPSHRLCTRLLFRALDTAAPEGWYAGHQAPLTLDRSEPEPDVALVRGALTGFADRHPGPADAGLVAEVANTSLARDRSVRKRIYAQAGIPEYWLVDLNGRRVEVHSDPRDGAYRMMETFSGGDSIPVRLDGAEAARIAVDAILPPRSA